MKQKSRDFLLFKIVHLQVSLQLKLKLKLNIFKIKIHFVFYEFQNSFLYVLGLIDFSSIISMNSRSSKHSAIQLRTTKVEKLVLHRRLSNQIPVIDTILIDF